MRATLRSFTSAPLATHQKRAGARRVDADAVDEGEARARQFAQRVADNALDAETSLVASIAARRGAASSHDASRTAGAGAHGSAEAQRGVADDDDERVGDGAGVGDEREEWGGLVEVLAEKIRADRQRLKQQSRCARARACVCVCVSLRATHGDCYVARWRHVKQLSTRQQRLWIANGRRATSARALVRA
jgi:hypothetical protein